MENPTQHYAAHESMYVADEKEEKTFLHNEEEETGPADDPAVQEPGTADVDQLLNEISEEPGEDDLEDDDDQDTDDEEFPIAPDLDGNALDDDDLEEDDLEEEDDLV